MSEYIVTARKWRPVLFEDVVGQDHVTHTLRNALQTNRIAHAYLFSGPRGVGKTTTARLLAKAVNCLHLEGSNPDNACENCVEITEGRSFDVLEIDGASNRGVEEIRNLRDSVRYTPTKGRYKVYIIDEVHMLTKEAFNALLKTLEEPPSHVIFIFATTEIHKVPATILSRCQRFDFHRIAVHQIADNIRMIAQQEGIALDEEALLLVARKGDGSLRDAQSFFDQVIALCGKRVTHAHILEALNVVDQELYFQVTELMRTSDAKAIALVELLMTRGYDLREFVSGLQEHFRNLLIVKATHETRLIEASDVTRTRYEEIAVHVSILDLLRCQRMVAATEGALRYSAHPRFKLESDMVQLVTMSHAVDVKDLVERVEEMKKKLSGGETQIPRGSDIRRAPAVASRPSPSRTAESAPPPQPFPQPLRTAPPPSSPTPAVTSGPTLSEDELKARWQEFVSEVRKERISLGSVLDQTFPLGVAGGTIRIGCANDFLVSSVMRSREQLAEIAFRVYRVRNRIIAEQHEGGAPPLPGSPESAQEIPLDEHPVVKAMKRELGAEPI